MEGQMREILQRHAMVDGSICLAWLSNMQGVVVVPGQVTRQGKARQGKAGQGCVTRTQGNIWTLPT